MAEERIEMDPTLESVLRYCLDEAKKRLEDGEPVVPFSALAVGETLFMEQHGADDPAESFAAARKTVAGAKGAAAYGFCYDGYIDAETMDGKPTRKDCIIAEGGTPGAEYGHAIGLIYNIDDEGAIKFNKDPIYVSKALNYMATMGMDDGYEVETFTGAADPEQD